VGNDRILKETRLQLITSTHCGLFCSCQVNDRARNTVMDTSAIATLSVLAVFACSGCAHAPRAGELLSIAGAGTALMGVAIASGGSSCQDGAEPHCEDNDRNAQVGWPLACVGAAVLIAGVVMMASAPGSNSNNSSTRLSHRPAGSSPSPVQLAAPGYLRSHDSRGTGFAVAGARQCGRCASAEH
jgi:hypothetical protein